MDTKWILDLIVKAQNSSDWTGAKAELIDLLKRTDSKEEFEFIMQEIQDRDWFF